MELKLSDELLLKAYIALQAVQYYVYPFLMNQAMVDNALALTGLAMAMIIW